MKKKLGPQDIFFPVPAALVVSGTFENPNIATIAWVGMVSSTPPTISISLDKRRFSLEAIRDFREFTVNIPSAEYYKETDFCGLVSGRNVDKFEKVGFTPEKSRLVGAPIIKECPFNLECRLSYEMQLGDYIMLLGEIVESHIDEDKVVTQNDPNASNRLSIDMSRINPLIYCATIREYWSMGHKLGNAFQVGKEILKQTGSTENTVQ